MHKTTDIENRKELESYLSILTSQGQQINFASIAKLAGVSRQRVQQKYSYLKEDYPELRRKRGMLKTDLTLYLESLDTSDLTVSEIEVLADKFCEARKIKRKGGVSAIYGILIRNKKPYQKNFHISETTLFLKSMDTSLFTLEELLEILHKNGMREIKKLNSLRTELHRQSLPYKRIRSRGEK